MKEDEPAPNPPGPQVNAATFTTATTGLALWGLEGVFHGYVPGAVYAWVILAVPMALGRLSAQLAYRRARNRHDGL